MIAESRSIRLGSEGHVRRAHALSQGAELLESGGTRFRIWAPGFGVMRLAVNDPTSAKTSVLTMRALPDGWHELLVASAGADTLYEFVLPDDTHVPDPASRCQPNDVHGASEVIDPTAFEWTDHLWHGRPWCEAVLYEIHIGTFTAEGTFLAAIGKLDHLVELGVTAVEVMPIGEFPGRRNWGYDGVLPYAPDCSYGRPEDFKAFVQAAHQRGLMVLLDVVYNHFGPDGNYLPRYAPKFFTDRHKTGWGSALNFEGSEGKPVREFIVHNALYWLEEYNVDGLRLDAVHAILDDSVHHLLDELAERARALKPNVHLLLENEDNQARRLDRERGGRPRHYTAQWNDDVHHALHTAATGESNGYYGDYVGNTDRLGRALAEGFAFQGELMVSRGSPRGEPSAYLPPLAFVSFLQNHDQVGNRAFGERLHTIASADALRAVTSVYLLLPQIPMLFMGEEWAASQPFPYFCDFEPDLAEAIRKGRSDEFSKFPDFQDDSLREKIPNPQAESTFESAKLRWDEIKHPEHSQWLALYQALLTVRRNHIVPLLAAITRGGVHEIHGYGAVTVRWSIDDHVQLRVVCNLSEEPCPAMVVTGGRTLWQQGEPWVDGGASAWFVRWCIEAVRPGNGSSQDATYIQ